MFEGGGRGKRVAIAARRGTTIKKTKDSAGGGGKKLPSAPAVNNWSAESGKKERKRSVGVFSTPYRGGEGSWIANQKDKPT